MKQLETSLKEVRKDYFDRFEEQLVILVNDILELGDTERVTVYKHERDHFVMLGRYSQHPQYRQKRRGIYPQNQGCIQRAWEGGDCFVDDLPDPDASLEVYLDAQRARYNIPKEEARKFRMKSRSYAAYAITESRGQDRIAVVVFESTRKQGLDRPRIVDVLNTSERKRISRFIEKERPFEPTPNLAEQEGY
jgi:hypothetical protein